MPQHENYKADNAYGKNGIWYEGYFFPVNQENPEKTIVKTLYGSETYLDRCTGFCCLKKLYLTEAQMKNHQCRAKQCKKFIKSPYSESYWKAIEDKKAMKKLKKQNALYDLRKPNKQTILCILFTP